MRVLFLNTDYSSFVAWFYRRTPSLALRDYDTQMAARDASLFGTADFMSRPFVSQGHAAIDIHANNRLLQEAWAFSRHHEMRGWMMRVASLVARIAADMPGYTVHDVTHLDALWETTDLLCSEKMSLTPPEAFVFGMAVLLHDAGMTLAAYPGGLSELKATIEWSDAVALYSDSECRSTK